MTALTERPKADVLCHAINNRMNSIAIGMSILEQTEREEVRKLIHTMQQDFDELQDLLEQFKTEAPK